MPAGHHFHWQTDRKGITLIFRLCAPLEPDFDQSGEPFFLLFRLYGPDKPLSEKTWRLADVEKIGI